jgi:hypothetical protein
MINKIMSVIISALLAGCAHSTIAQLGPSVRKTLIPIGSHQQSVIVHLKKVKLNRKDSMRFSGVLDVREDRVQLIGLTPFGSTLFRVKEDLKTGNVVFETDNEQMKKAEPYVKSTYRPIREMLKIPYPPVRSEATVGDIKFRFENFNAQDLPLKILVDTPDFNLEILEDGYAP